MTEAEAVERFINAGDYIGTELYGTVRCPMSLVNEIVRQRIQDLRVAGQGVYELDILLGSHAIKALDLTYLGLEVYGISSCLRREVESGRTTCVEWSNAGIAWRFKAGRKWTHYLRRMEQRRNRLALQSSGNGCALHTGAFNVGDRHPQV